MALVLDGDNGIVGVLTTNTDGDVIFDTDTLFVDAPNNAVGIGTLTPTRKLHVDGSGRFDMAAGTVRISEQQSMVSVQGVNNAETGFADLKIDGSNVILNVQSGGNVGIGTTSPGETLEVNGNMFINVASGNPNLTIKTAGAGNNPFARLQADSTYWDILGVFSSADDPLHFQYGGSDKMIITNSGNVGIGTTSPLNKFVVAEGTGQHGVEIGPGTLSYIQAYDRATSDYGDLSIDAQTIRFATDNGTERMRITSTGVLQGTSDAEIATSPIRTHSNTISTSTTIDANDNAVASGPLAIADGVTLTINGNMTVV